MRPGVAIDCQGSEELPFQHYRVILMRHQSFMTPRVLLKSLRQLELNEPPSGKGTGTS